MLFAVKALFGGEWNGPVDVGVVEARVNSFSGSSGQVLADFYFEPLDVSFLIVVVEDEIIITSSGSLLNGQVDLS
jgi:hypothetical protein